MGKVRSERQGGFLFLTLDDAPMRNALSPVMVQEPGAALDAAVSAAGGLADSGAKEATGLEARLHAVLQGIARCAQGANAATFRESRDAARVETIVRPPGASS